MPRRVGRQFQSNAAHHAKNEVPAILRALPALHHLLIAARRSMFV
jgi:hypothetical protein